MLPWAGYFRRTAANLGLISDFMAELNPDLIGLVEVDAGTFRSHRLNQAEILAGALGHYHVYKSKYVDKPFTRWAPILNRQGNAFLTRDTIRHTKFHYFERGAKRLVIELEMDNLTVFLVHLALTFRARQHQLTDLFDLVNGAEKPHIVAGDFNAFWGPREMGLFLAATRLKNANTRGQATFPSWKPTRELDFILHSPDIRIERFWRPEVRFSDHLPLVCDFTTA